MIAIGFIEAIDKVKAAGATGTGTGHELPGELRFRARREGARLLMAHMDPLDLALTDGVGDAVKRVADDPVAPLYAGCLQCFDQYVGHSLTPSLTPRVVEPGSQRRAQRHVAVDHWRSKTSATRAS